MIPILGMAVPMVGLVALWWLYQGERAENHNLRKELGEAVSANETLKKNFDEAIKEARRAREVVRMSQQKAASLQAQLNDTRSILHEVENIDDECRKSLDARMCDDVYGVLSARNRDGDGGDVPEPATGAVDNTGAPGPLWADDAGRH